MLVAYLNEDKASLDVAMSYESTWQTPVTIDSSGSASGSCSAAFEGDGTPWVSYRRNDTGALWCAGPVQTPLWTTQTLYALEDAAHFVSLFQGPDNRYGSVFYRYDEIAGGTVCFMILENDQKGSVRKIVDGIGTSGDSPAHVDLYITPDNRWNIAYRDDIEQSLYFVTADTVPTGVNDDRDITEHPSVYIFSLSQNFPNPFNPVTTIKYRLDTREWVTLDVFDVRGAFVARLEAGFQEQGEYSVRWHGVNSSQEQISTGVYFYRLKAGRRTITKKMLLLK
jgi:hypothetical protein